MGEESVVSKRKGNLQRKEGRGVGERPPPRSPGGCRSPRVCLQGGAGMKGGPGAQAVRPGDVSYHRILRMHTCRHTHERTRTHMCTHEHTHTLTHRRRFHCRCQASAPTALLLSRWVPTEGRGPWGISIARPHPQIPTSVAPRAACLMGAWREEWDLCL